MCGIVAAASPRALPASVVAAGMAALAHRGPDGEGAFRSPDGSIHLGHRRLAIVDLDGGAQPIPNEDGTIVAVVNGEFYDDDEIRRDLQRRGHRFRSHCDSELLVHLYEDYGEDCVHHLHGEFAFVLWDANRRVLFAARDRLGVKPLHFAHQGDRLLLASEAKALFAMGVPRHWDRNSLRSALTLQYLPIGRSLFDGVRQVSPGASICWHAGRTQHQRWWRLGDLDAPVAPATTIGADLERAVARRLRSDVPVAFALSGGIDSASIAALAAQRSARLDCFTVCFDAGPFDESEQARATAEHLGARWHPVSAKAGELLEALPAAVAASESLTINGQLPGKHLLNRAVRAAGFPVILTGEGADECLLGYPFLRRDAGLDAGQRATVSAGIMHAADTPALPEVSHRWGYVPAFLAAKAAFGQSLQHALEPGDHDPLGAFLDAMEEDDPEQHPAQRSADLWTRTCLADYILRALGDGAEMASGVEGRPPFLDHQLFANARGLPVEARLRPGLEKPALRAAVAHLLPTSVVGRGKQPFLSPPLLQTPAGRAFATEILRNREARELPGIDVDKLDIEATPEPALLLLLSAILLQRAYSLTSP